MEKGNLWYGNRPTRNSRVSRWTAYDLSYFNFGIFTKYLTKNEWNNENSGFGFGLKFLFTVENFPIKELCQVTFGEFFERMALPNFRQAAIGGPGPMSGAREYPTSNTNPPISKLFL